MKKGSRQTKESIEKQMETKRKNNSMKFLTTKEYSEKMKNIALERGYGKWMKGKISLGTLNNIHKMAEEKKGRPRPEMKGRTPWNKGKECPALSKSNHWNWQGGISNPNRYIRTTKEYYDWRKSVLERDSYSCIWCSSKSELQVDHIKPFSKYPELRFTIDNGRTLCKSCHRKTDTWGVNAIYL